MYSHQPSGSNPNLLRRFSAVDSILGSNRIALHRVQHLWSCHAHGNTLDRDFLPFHVVEHKGVPDASNQVEDELTIGWNVTDDWVVPGKI